MTRTDREPPADAGAPPPMPRWVKLFVLFVGIVVVVAITMHAAGHRLGGHGTGGHAPPAGEAQRP